MATSETAVRPTAHASPTDHAVAAAREFAGEDRVVVLNSDNHYPADALRALVAAPGSALLGFDRAALVERSNIPPERIRAFVAAEEEPEIEGPVIVRGPSDLPADMAQHIPAMIEWHFANPADR